MRPERSDSNGEKLSVAACDLLLRLHEVPSFADSHGFSQILTDLWQAVEPFSNVSMTPAFSDAARAYRQADVHATD